MNIISAVTKIPPCHPHYLTLTFSKAFYCFFMISPTEKMCLDHIYIERVWHARSKATILQVYVIIILQLCACRRCKGLGAEWHNQHEGSTDVSSLCVGSMGSLDEEIRADLLCMSDLLCFVNQT